MHKRSILLGLGCLLLLTGCDHTRWNIFRPPDPAPSSKVQTVEQLVAYLNENASRIDTIKCDDLSLTCSQGIQSFGLRGKIVAEKPRNLRMVADVGGNRVVDMGSNTQEFWYWVSKAEPPYQFFCAYEALKTGTVKHMPFPFQPEWVLEAMGMGPYSAPDKYQRDHDAETVKLIEKTVSPQGKPVRKVIVFRRRPVEPPQPQLMYCQLVDDATSKELCSVHILETTLDRVKGAVIPRRLELRCPEEKIKLAMSLTGVEANQPIQNPAVFVRQPLRGVPSYDLARGLLDGQPIQRLHGSR